ncbi:hypothetical protein, partial [Hallerella porci]|uniref:hypothetical protein n=1 Tax=Hallerella porci TaxID=1945871 RepID=UPI001E616B5A
SFFENACNQEGGNFVVGDTFKSAKNRFRGSLLILQGFDFVNCEAGNFGNRFNRNAFFQETFGEGTRFPRFAFLTTFGNSFRKRLSLPLAKDIASADETVLLSNAYECHI